MESHECLIPSQGFIQFPSSNVPITCYLMKLCVQIDGVGGKANKPESLFYFDGK